MPHLRPKSPPRPKHHTKNKTNSKPTPRKQPMNQQQTDTLLEILTGIYIQTLRIYDQLAIIGDKLGADTTQLANLHEQGHTIGPDPALTIDQDQGQT